MARRSNSSVFESLGKAALAAVLIILLIKTIRRREGMTNSSEISPLSIEKPSLMSDPIGFIESTLKPETRSYSVGDQKPDPQCVPHKSRDGLFPFFSRI
jgi:hypothetical protein